MKITGARRSVCVHIAAAQINVGRGAYIVVVVAVAFESAAAESR